MVIVESTARLVPGVIKLSSLAEESHWNLLLKKEATSTKGLEYPHYTRPETISIADKKRKVPKVLLSGDHKKIKERREKHKG
jgi:tRNA (guanine37-N1)-methyltransferase